MEDTTPEITRKKMNELEHINLERWSTIVRVGQNMN
jgi:hypothetical protein